MTHRTGQGSAMNFLQLRNPDSRGKFVSSARAFITKYGFDGLDLGWQFPLIRVKERGTLGSFWHKVKKTFGYSKGSKDLQAEEHRAGFSALIKQMKLALRPDGYLLTASVIPHTNYTSKIKSITFRTMHPKF